jgi:hypothetical protein
MCEDTVAIRWKWEALPVRAGGWEAQNRNRKVSGNFLDSGGLSEYTPAVHIAQLYHWRGAARLNRSSLFLSDKWSATINLPVSDASQKRCGLDASAKRR